MVARVAVLISSSAAASSHHGARKNPRCSAPAAVPDPSPEPVLSPSPLELEASSARARAATSSSYASTRFVLAARRAWALSRSWAWTLSSSCRTAGTSSAGFSGTGFFSLPKGRAFISPAPLLTSRGPTSIRSGTPFRSHSKYLAPGRSVSRSSTFTRTPAALRALVSSSTAASTLAWSSSVLPRMGTTTTWMGATGGGRTRPASSLWVMTSAPTSRVETPQLVAHTRDLPPEESWKVTSNAWAKFCPKKWDVPD
mmetsp:Transcript_6884/g.15784  ORF Transcript_6884/g.15784 Transcript_6884/m.15784 type:complete len:255 (+) Transcript_6884:324-1088(+)